MAEKSASPEEQRGMKLIAEAEKKAGSGKSGGFWSKFAGGGSSKIDEAIDLFCQAANQFKMAKNWSQAGYAFSQAAGLNLQSDNKNEAASKYIDASVCYKKIDANQAIECLKKAVEIQTEMGRFSMAAKQHITIAEIYESELQNIDQAIVHYERAADYYQGEESQSHAAKCLQKVAHYAAEKEDYMKAIQIFEQIANRNAENAMLKYSAKEYFFKAALCHLCVDPLNAQHALTRYEETFPSFQDTREYGLLKKVLGCMEDSNVDGFTEAVREYDSISRIDQWTTQLLLRAKRTLGEADLT
ncbi:alpha-soluble NSF attachment protein-like [Paramacrobiotus metropolitanus]|uniref:alpha-soluble NSF attachment protein-like n=1 Tax=Paramacrobiotus metropolitanus TaxID=2943436 RepID=UPI002445A504|nr:alpha-soluble NSF attachment protein-like [Paramacrobiotus metropolitanus]